MTDGEDGKKRKHRQYNRRWSRANRQKVKKIYRRSVAKKKAAGLCARCGSAELKSKTLCIDCLDKSKKASAKWRASNIEKVRRKERLAARAKRRAHPRKYRKYRKSHYAANRDRLLARRRAKEGQMPRGEYLNLVRAHKVKPKKARGRGKEQEENKTYYKTGQAVEKEIPINLKQDRHSIVEARRRVAANTHFEVDVVAQYHQRFRRQQARTEIPS